MLAPDRAADIAGAIRHDIDSSHQPAKRLKFRSLLRKFGYAKRSDSNTAEITRALSKCGITINPPIVRLGAGWHVGVDDWIYLSTRSGNTSPTAPDTSVTVPIDWNGDAWFDRIEHKVLRTEKEVELKFIVPLLAKLGYSEDDRYDGMPIPAAHGSRATTLVIDFALFNTAIEALRNQPLLTVEAKREERLKKAKEIRNAHNQAKSYCLWTQCDYFMVTDSRTVQVFHVARGGIEVLSPLFSCSRQDLRSQFDALYKLVSKEVLTARYLSKLASMEELR